MLRGDLIDTARCFSTHPFLSVVLRVYSTWSIALQFEICPQEVFEIRAKEVLGLAFGVRVSFLQKQRHMVSLGRFTHKRVKYPQTTRHDTAVRDIVPKGMFEWTHTNPK